MLTATLCMLRFSSVPAMMIFNIDAHAPYVLLVAFEGVRNLGAGICSNEEQFQCVLATKTCSRWRIITQSAVFS